MTIVLKEHEAMLRALLPGAQTDQQVDKCDVHAAWEYVAGQKITYKFIQRYLLKKIEIKMDQKLWKFSKTSKWVEIT